MSLSLLPTVHVGAAAAAAPVAVGRSLALLPDDILWLLLKHLNYVDLIEFGHAVRFNRRLFAFAMDTLLRKVQLYYPTHQPMFGLLRQLTLKEMEKLILLRTYGRKCRQDLHKFPRVQLFLMGK